MIKPRGLFIFNPNDLGTEPAGGVQRCSSEYLRIIKRVCSDVELFPVQVSRSFRMRAKRALSLTAYALYEPQTYRHALKMKLTESKVDVVFINKAELIRFVPEIKSLSCHVQVVVLSHGNESGDLLYEWFNARDDAYFARAWKDMRLGQILRCEVAIRHATCPRICVMSSDEAALERWLGARDVFFCPRVIRPEPLSWEPVPGRAGFIGTLDHTPNRIALDRLCKLLPGRSDSLEIEIIGRPEEIGRNFSEKYRFVRYLGALSDAEARAAASRWSLFLNPIFWQSRGASMKLGQGISWGLPVLTTRAGRRGYLIPAGLVLESPDTAEAFVEALGSVLFKPKLLLQMNQTLVEKYDDFPSELSIAKEMQTWLGYSTVAEDGPAGVLDRANTT